ncbi:MAG: hypothetical protein HWD61_00330 [Parachlamydiaceae bacterium]|nr:MAG: hypothetical protein HWD61_00330 [Parachlamydiaceae bacterium]
MENFGNNSANKLFERMPELTYLEEWASLLAQVPEKDAEIKETSLVIFRLSDEWFALPTLIFQKSEPNTRLIQCRIIMTRLF